MEQRELSHALLNKDVIVRIHKRYGAVKGLCHWMRSNLDIAQHYQIVDNGQVARAIGTLDKLAMTPGSESMGE